MYIYIYLYLNKKKYLNIKNECLIIYNKFKRSEQAKNRSIKKGKRTKNKTKYQKYTNIVKKQNKLKSEKIIRKNVFEFLILTKKNCQKSHENFS